MIRDWQTTIYGLLSHPLTGDILLLSDAAAGWSLPKIHMNGQFSLTPELATREFQPIIGIEVIANRYVRITEDQQKKCKEGIFVFESLNPIEERILNGRWVGRKELSHIQFSHPEHLEVINQYIRESETKTIPQFRQPWERNGWFKQVTTWMNEALGVKGIEVVGQPEQIKWWSLSCVLKTATTHGDMYFKASARQPLFVNEPIIVKYLENLIPEHVPKVIASEPTNAWMVTRDFGTKLGRDIPIEQKVNVIQVFGTIQLESVGKVTELLQLGCKDRRPHHLIPCLRPLLEDELIVSKLTVEEITELRRQVPKIEEMCSRLSEFSVPTTLVHGDLHLGNVALDKGRLIYFDWTDACITHPFLDMLPIFNERVVEQRLQLRDAYLRLWKEYEPIERLNELWSLCEVVHAIHHAISYQSILHNTEERCRGELGGSPAFHLRKALQYLG